MTNTKVKKKVKLKIIFSFIIIIIIIFLINTKSSKEIVNEINNNEIIVTVAKDETNKIEEPEILSYYKGYPVIAKLEIPKINLETNVLSECTVETLNISVTKYYGCNPNEIGNFCISGHNFITQNMFHDIKNLKIGDTLKLTDGKNRTLEYIIYDMFEVLPKQTECLTQKTDGKKEVTLITCTSDSKKRIIVKAQEIK